MISEKVHDHIIHKVKENSMLDVYAKNALKFKSRTHTLNNLHELAEQVFKPPSYYLFLSDISL